MGSLYYRLRIKLLTIFWSFEEWTTSASLTHLCRMEFPILNNWTSPFPFKGCWVILFIFIQILIEHSVSKQWRP